MPKYISQHEAIRAVQICCGDYKATRSAICNLPSVDAVPVIRCEKCAESCCVNDILFCAYWGKETREDGYCHEAR